MYLAAPYLMVGVAMLLFLTLVLVIRFCKHHHLCCPLGNPPGCTLQRLPSQRLPHATMMTLAATSAMTQIFLDVHVSAQTVGVHMYPLHLFLGSDEIDEDFCPVCCSQTSFHAPRTCSSPKLDRHNPCTVCDSPGEAFWR